MVHDPTPGSALLVVRVKPQARRAGLLGRHGAAIKVAVRAAPERGRANEELLQVLAAALGVAVSALELVSGAGSQDKRIRVHGLDEPELQRRLQAALDATGGPGSRRDRGEGQEPRGGAT
jgi:uncharacterized protein (TIGR00251 family)